MAEELHHLLEKKYPGLSEGTEKGWVSLFQCPLSNVRSHYFFFELLKKVFQCLRLSRGVITKAGQGTNGRFNQDLSEKAILIEVGGIYNTLDETYRTAEALAEVFSEYYWAKQKVNE